MYALMPVSSVNQRRAGHSRTSKARIDEEGITLHLQLQSDELEALALEAADDLANL